jgi:ketosteroid isomerase-like protein
MQRRFVLPAVLGIALLGCAATPALPPPADARLEVMARERAFAKTMADRDHAAFAGFIAEEAVFFSASTALRGRPQIVDGWARFYAGPNAPFSWQPDDVEVLASGAIALSSGPVRDANGKLIARFNSVWRRSAAGSWEIIFDKGSEVCDCKPQ